MGHSLLIAKSLKLLSWMAFSFCYQLTKEKINLKTVSLQIIMTWHGNDVYAYTSASL